MDSATAGADGRVADSIPSKQATSNKSIAASLETSILGSAAHSSQGRAS
jgi:hypothetical protein